MNLLSLFYKHQRFGIVTTGAAIYVCHDFSTACKQLEILVTHILPILRMITVSGYVNSYPLTVTPLLALQDTMVTNWYSGYNIKWNHKTRYLAPRLQVRFYCFHDVRRCYWLFFFFKNLQLLTETCKNESKWKISIWIIFQSKHSCHMVTSTTVANTFHTKNPEVMAFVFYEVS